MRKHKTIGIMGLLILALCVPKAFSESKSFQAAPATKLKMPETPAGRCASTYVESFNSADVTKMKSFFKQYYSDSDLKERSIESRLKRYYQLREIFQTLTPAYLGLSLERQISLLCTASGTDNGIVFRFQLRDAKPYKIEFMTVSAINIDGVDFSSSNATKEIQETINYVANRAQPVDDAMRKDTVEKAARGLREEYLYPEMGQKMADKLMQNLSAGLYDEHKSTGKLADKLTEDMVALCKDRHLWIEATNPLHDQSIYAYNRSVEDLRRDNYGFRKTEILPGNVGYIKFDMIYDDEEALEIAASALAFVAHCDALIFDIRDNIGGEWGTAQLIISYFFKEQTITGHSYDRTGQIIGTGKTLEDIPGKRFDPALPVYILTSNRTGSAAEGFAYILKHFKKATIVGETTLGMAHPSKELVINKLFRISVPFRRSENAITKTNWENVGVIPHIKVEDSKALEAAIEEAKKRRINPSKN
ncbi:MAG: hypothetical protein GTN73_04420 [Candidatus Aminicenantes bacterium]|nr:hypothetical protein [Candidatus Aminicenantes bacterium]